MKQSTRYILAAGVWVVGCAFCAANVGMPTVYHFLVGSAVSVIGVLILLPAE